MKRKLVIVFVAALILGNFWGRIEFELNELALPRGRLEVRSLCDLYDGGLLDEVLSDSSRDVADKRCQPYAPQILYIRWQAMRRLSLLDQADHLQSEFLARYPMHPLGANMLWAKATSCLAAGDYASADRGLAMLSDRYPDSPLSVAARDVRLQLH
jgi:hypothetical protein